MSNPYRFAHLVEQAVAAAPPLTPEQLDALAVLFATPEPGKRDEELPTAA